MASGRSFFGAALQKEMRKAIKAGRHAFESGYRDAVYACRGLPYDTERLALFERERYRYLPQIHGLCQNGFLSRIGHYNHTCRRNDWRAVSRDITNLHLGPTMPDVFAEALEDVRFALKNKAEITYSETVGIFHWPSVLRPWNGLMHYAAESLSSQGQVHINAEIKGRNIVLTLKAPDMSVPTLDKSKTLRIMKDVVGYFRGEIETGYVDDGFYLAITLPAKIRIDDYYGGSRRSKNNARN